MLLTLGYFFLALLLLISVHEYGHFLVARLCGVKVLRFSFGFGKVLLSRRDKHGTEYAWSLFPLGGYVKMLDEAEGDVPLCERHLAFNNKPIWARIAIVLAGPLFNFLFAFVALWLVLVIGIRSLAPIIDSVAPDSIAARAGLLAHHEIVAMNGEKITSWRDVQYALMPLLGTSNPVAITMKSLKNGYQKTVMLPLSDWQLDGKNPDALASLGVTPFVPSIPPIVGEVVPDSPAGLAGLHVGDVIKSVNGKPLTDWLMLVDFVRKNPKERVTLVVHRDHQDEIFIIPMGRDVIQGKAVGYLGVRSERVEWPPHWLRVQRASPLSAINVAFKQTMELTKTTFMLIGRLITGHLPVQSISGPVGIAQGAGESGRSGLAYYLSFLALVSISLGVLNLLPIPMLDGGHLFYYLIELVKRKPVSQGAKSIGIYVGLLLLVALMVIALTNDVSRLTG